MINLNKNGIFIHNGKPVEGYDGAPSAEEGISRTIAYSIMNKHNVSSDSKLLRLKFDSLISHDITYVGIIQTALASGMKEFPIPYALTNCHNSLCAVGGTINEDDHIFGLSAARKFGGIYVPANLAVIHQYAREAMSGCGRMILGSDSHTRYGALGTMGVGEGGPELVKQLLKGTYDVAAPEVVLVYLEGAPKKGVGPHDVAIALCGAVYKQGFVENRILEFAGPGIENLPMDYRIGIDVMTTETACLSSIWETDELVHEYLAQHGRNDAYSKLSIQEGAYYDRMVSIDLGSIEPMIALPFHPSEAYTIRELIENPTDILREAEKRAEARFGGKVKLDLVSKCRDGKIYVDQGIIAGCSGGMYDNIAEAAAILDGYGTGDGYFNMSVYPPSMPVNMELIKNGVQQSLMTSGVTMKSCFCGPCFGAGDVPGNNALSIRHTTRNFPNREGSKPGDGQISAVALMDARSIAATARMGGVLIPATDIDYVSPQEVVREYNTGIYEKRVYNGWGKPITDEELRYGPNITPWPQIDALGKNMLIELAAVIRDPVTTTDELIPSGETSSYRSNPMKLAEFALSRRCPDYVGKAKAVKEKNNKLKNSEAVADVAEALSRIGADAKSVQFGSCVFANKPGDGSAREQAASCQRVLGGSANICYEYATKRYRSNCINWGMLPFTLDAETEFDCEVGDMLYIPNIRKAVEDGADGVDATIIPADKSKECKSIHLNMFGLTAEDREILLRGCLMNWYAAKSEG